MSDILIGVTGSIAAYKAASLVSFLSKQHAVKVMMSRHATDFITPLTMLALSKQAVITDTCGIGCPGVIDHIYYSQNSDVMVIAPATANILAKAAAGIADDVISASIVAASIPIIFVPSMNETMYLSETVQGNIKALKKRGCRFVEPDTGELACGVSGKGKYPKTERIVREIEQALHPYRAGH